jgi:tRNA(fMet)-specific endonuclease VapC
MGLILDTSILIADERGKFDMPGLLRQFPSPQPVIAAITASELLHGVERAQDPARRARRQQHVE